MAGTRIGLFFIGFPYVEFLNRFAVFPHLIEVVQEFHRSAIHSYRTG